MKIHVSINIQVIEGEYDEFDMDQNMVSSIIHLIDPANKGNSIS